MEIGQGDTSTHKIAIICIDVMHQICNKEAAEVQRNTTVDSTVQRDFRVQKAYSHP